MNAPSWSWKAGTMLKGSVLNLFLGKRKTLHSGATRARNFMQFPRLPCSHKGVLKHKRLVKGRQISKTMRNAQSKVLSKEFCAQSWCQKHMPSTSSSQMTNASLPVVQHRRKWCVPSEHESKAATLESPMDYNPRVQCCNKLAEGTIAGRPAQGASAFQESGSSAVVKKPPSGPCDIQNLTYWVVEQRASPL